jgi:hypothetical protein
LSVRPTTAFLAPIAMASFWQMTARICSCREEPSDSYDFAV